LASAEWLTDASKQTGLKTDDLRGLIERASTKIMASLGIQERPLNLEGNRLSTTGIAGLVRLSPTLELEIVPKFLDGKSPSWRDDLFFLASISPRGFLFSRDVVQASNEKINDLFSLAGRYLVQEIERLQRRPLRFYNYASWIDWSYDGEIDPDDLLFPGADGFTQTGLALNRSNEVNAVILAAVKLLLSRVVDPEVRRRLTRASAYLSPQQRIQKPSHTSTLPGRHSHWQPAYTLASQVLDGLGVGIGPGALTAPGFVINSWRLWEDLIRRAVQLRFPVTSRYHPIHRLGNRTDSSEVSVIPDLQIAQEDGASLIIDAKYKGRSDREARISNADLYESLAFMEASGLRTTLLVYPSSRSNHETNIDTGAIEVLDQIIVGERRVVAAAIDVVGISKRDGYKHFCDGVFRVIESLARKSSNKESLVASVNTVAPATSQLTRTHF